MKRFSATLLAGLATILPLIITFALIFWVAAFINGKIGPNSAIGRWLITNFGDRFWEIVLVYAVSIILVVLILWLIGMLARNYVGKRLLNWFDMQISRIPLINTVYSSVEQVVNLLHKEEGDNTVTLTDVVCMKLANSWLLGLLASNEPVEINGKLHYLVYVPSCPMPTSGFTYLVPIEDTLSLNISAEELTRVIVSLGSLGPRVMNEKDPLVEVIEPMIPGIPENPEEIKELREQLEDNQQDSGSGD